MTLRKLLATSALLVASAGTFVWAMQEFKSGIAWSEPKVVTPPATVGAPPSDATVLFDGKDLSQWVGGEKWEIKDGYAITDKGDIKTKESFGDCQLHIEFCCPAKVVGKGQGRGNSGVFMSDRYEIQVLDSFENPTYFDGQCGSIYKQSPPMVNVCRKPGEWQSYDILYTAPTFDEAGKLTKKAYVTVLHNGVVIHNHFEIQGNTWFDKAHAYTPHALKQPIHLQFHGNKTMFRNIWIREMKQIEGKKPTK